MDAAPTGDLGPLARTVQEQQVALYWWRSRRRAPSSRIQMREGDALVGALEDLLEDEVRLLPGPLHANLVRWAAGVDAETGGESMRQHRNSPSGALVTCFELQGRLMRRARLERRQRGIVIPFTRPPQEVDLDEDDDAEEALD